MKQALRIFTFCFASIVALGANQSLNLVAGTTGAPVDNAMGPTQDARVEFELHTWTYPASEVAIFDLQGTGIRASAGPGYMRFTLNRAGDAYPGGTPCSLAPTEGAHILIRIERNHSGGSTGTASCEIFNVDGTNRLSQTLTLTAIGTGLSNNSTIGSASFTGKLGFLRVFSTTVAINARPPTTADGGNVSEWKFDGNLNDSSGNSHTLTYSGASYTNTPDLLVYAKLQTYGHPTWSDWVSMRAGYTNQLDASGSYSMSDVSSTPSTYFWQQLSGPNILRWSSRTTAQPLVYGAVTGMYSFQVRVTDASSSSLATLNVGSVAFNSSGVIIPADPKVSQIFGPMIAFGRNKWASADERNLYSLNAQIVYQSTAYDSGWVASNQGTISYTFGGKGQVPFGGTPCTTLNGGIDATTATITVTNAACLSLAGLPGEATWIQIGNSSAALEIVRICSRSGNVLTACYDGRGVAGNNIDSGGAPVRVAAQSWSTGTIVGEYRIQGTSTLFSTDPNRPLCPAGVPGPQGPVIHSTGTVALTAGSTTINGTNTAWPTTIVGGAIRVVATHDGSTPFIFWARIVSRASTTQIVVDRTAPTGVDEMTQFSHKITGTAMYLSQEFIAEDGHTARMINNGIGCESETAMFALGMHDYNTTINPTVMSGMKYTYKTQLTLYSVAGTFTSDFYCVGCLGRSFYYRSGYTPALTLANAIDEISVKDPEIADGHNSGSSLSLGGVVNGALIDLVLNSSTALTWPNVEKFTEEGHLGATACNVLDSRDTGYKASWTTFAANWHTDATKRAAHKVALGNLLTRDQTCKRTAGDGYPLKARGSFANSLVFNPLSTVGSNPVTLTAGSRTATGTGFINGSISTLGSCYGVDDVTIAVTNSSSIATLLIGSLTAQTGGDPTILIYIAGTKDSGATRYDGVTEFSFSGSTIQLGYVWPGDSGTVKAMTTRGGHLVSGGQSTGGYLGILATSTSPPADTLANNLALSKTWACKWGNSTTLTLQREWDGANGSGYYFSYYNIPPFTQQPFMLGIKTNQMKLATYNDDSGIAAGYAPIVYEVADWLNTYGWDPVTKGTLYSTVSDTAGDTSDVAAGDFYSTHGYQGVGTMGLKAGAAGVGRVNNAEAGVALQQTYVGNPTTLNKTTVDTFYGALYGIDPTLCDPEVLSTCDGTVIDTLSNQSQSAYKWPGFHFGQGGYFTGSWPAIREGATVADTRTLSITFNSSSIPAAANVRCTLYFPSGATEQTTVARTDGACAFTTADARQGTHTFKLEYLTAGAAVLATSDQIPIEIQ